MTGAAAPRLPAYSVFAGVLAAAGLPIYIHAPKFYVDEYGVSLAALGAVLFGLRLIDVVQDPVLGWISERLSARRGLAVGLGVALLAISMLALFAVSPPVAPLLWFGLCLTGLFTAFSFLTINFYAQGVRTAARLGDRGHVRLAAWRETGALLGVCLAAIAPNLAMQLTGHPFAAFAAGFAALALLAGWLMRPEWSRAGAVGGTGMLTVLSDPVARRLLIVALVNATPVAVTSTLFLFFVESRLQAPGWDGPLLLLFFISAAAAAPLWGRAAERHGAKRVLMAGMLLSIAAFGVAVFLGAGDTILFALVCLASGAALGADMTLLPAIFAGRLARVAPEAGQGFGLWSFVTKFTLAFAAAILLPLLEASGFESGTDNPPSALLTLTLLYAALPCALKFVAVGLLATTPLKEDS